MTEPTTPAGATPAAGGATPSQTPPAASAPEPTPQPQPASTSPEDSSAQDALGLGDAGKRALDAMKAERNAAVAAAKAAERELEELRAASLSETDKAIAAARKAGADEVTERLHARVRRAETKLALARAGAVPSLIEDLAGATEFAGLVVDDADQVAGLDDAIKAHKARVPDAYRTPSGPASPSAAGRRIGRRERRLVAPRGVPHRRPRLARRLGAHPRGAAGRAPAGVAVTSILAIDPGSAQSAWLRFEGGRPQGFGISANDVLVRALRSGGLPDVVVIEKVESYGMAVGAEVFDTVLWAGRFAEAAHRVPVFMLPRRAVKLALCADSRAKDANIRQALIDRFGGSAAIGRKAAPGPLYGISRDVWSALAIAVTYSLQVGSTEAA